MRSPWTQSTAGRACCRCDSAWRCATRRKSTPCYRPAAASCSIASKSSTAPAKWGCGSRCPSAAEADAAGKPVRSRPCKPRSTYLEQRRSHYRQTDAATERERQVVEQLLGRLQGAYREWRKLPATPALMIRLTFLVERERAAAFRSRTEEFARAWREGRCVVLGPWPPYSFV